MDKTMFELNLFENAKKDILDTPIEEGTQEFETKCPSMNPEEHFDKDASGDRKVTTDPAEKPTAKPADGEMGPVNSQTQTETPTAKPYDANSVSVPSKATLTVDQYNQAIDQLQKSFKEGAELLAALQQAQIINEEKATEEELAAMKVMTEMAETKPEQFNEWSITTLFTRPGIFAVLKDAAAKKEIDLEKDKTFAAAIKDATAIAEKLEVLTNKIKDLSTKTGSKDLSKKVEGFSKQFEKLMNGNQEKAEEAKTE